MQESEEIPFDAFVIGEYESALIQAYLRHCIGCAVEALAAAGHAYIANPGSVKDGQGAFWSNALSSLQGLLANEKQRKISDGIIEVDDAVGYTKGKLPGGESGE